MKYLSAKMSESLRRENERLRAEMMDACHDHALTLVGTVEMAASMHARELDGYRKREEENKQLRAKVPKGSVEEQKWIDLCDKASENETRTREENERLRAHTKKCNDLVLRLARQAAKDQGFELEPKHDVQGILASALQLSQNRKARIDAALDQLTYRRYTNLDQLRCILKGETWNPDDE